MNSTRQSRDSLDALDAHVQWGAIEVNKSQSPPVKPRKSGAPEGSVANYGEFDDQG